MDDKSEEFEPLFDYTRIQPCDVICLEDDSPDESPVYFPKRQKTSNLEVDKKVQNVHVKSVNLIDCDDNEDDWLPPPPKTFNYKTLGEDSTLKALRLKKQELASIAQSAEEVVRDVEESVRKELCASLESSQHSAEQPLETAPERKKIVISIQDKDGLKQFRVYGDDKFEQLFMTYANRINIDVKLLVFSFDGDKVSTTATPDSLEMEANDIIEVHVKPS